MIKFFRQIRQSLIMENKTSKYFKYAIGEIILVVIGILIALQINNWNEDRKNNTLERVFINNLITDLKSDVNHLNEVITFNEKKIIYFDSILAYSNKNINSLSDHTQLFLSILKATSQFESFKNQNRTLNNLVTLDNGIVRQNVTDSIANFQQHIEQVDSQTNYYLKSNENVNSLKLRIGS